MRGRGSGRLAVSKASVQGGTQWADPVRRGKISHPETLVLRVPWRVDYPTRETSAPRSSLEGPTTGRPGDPAGAPQVEPFTL
jgi:hypothetical protein